MAFNDYLNGWDSSENNDLPNLPGPVIENLTHATASMGSSLAEYQGSSLGPTRAVAFNQNWYPVECSPIMRDPQWVIEYSRGEFTTSLYNTNHARSTSGSDKNPIGLNDRYNILNTTLFPLPQWSLATGLSLPLPPSLVTANRAKQARPFACTTCRNVSFTLKKDLLRHKRTVHGNGKAYHCRCGKGDFRKDNHLRHVGNCNKTSPHNYDCICGFTHVTKEEYIAHVKSHLTTSVGKHEEFERSKPHCF
ncbi:hypothetical protein F5Y03DRAFT_377731 [Xylaria venustula]|nr:hypothetical protein F5Y03DRAFT_377731 [Xylaria venustula]